MEDKNLTLDFLNVTLAHLMSDVKQMKEYNNAFWKEEILSGQLEHAALTASLLRNLLYNFKEVE
ncbi:hypothetical protein [Leuconostoc mesenteroides]|uniref:hypothetical protein n=1 Tax=Leuconostoc mesenteroides TaxID=1245 RepID=UPI000A069667|nr:hypothetical protein [Leuconostoc mesenteroides]ORI38064.1 hypothetical protein BMR90_04625 [Leuconostoc mesenteroides subsp. cremoris]ORI38330.1 hypothetical protein BMR89_04765 [Leuconostoc mesenteroides subsp. cremoris]ORI41430.1 hypothetical protein BMR91_04260 [Leuconostoc mesenteroides subsp. cremoris]ORI42923.1 hypothetical protein BMR92_04065 [Leuconostoc mesenteroides subsp. cremoris]ORI44190.1 hypothetical protein BMR93_03030 [Leuconostoc mesenteroides subsp. cremoris]